MNWVYRSRPAICPGYARSSPISLRFLTTEPIAQVAPVHSKAMPMILTAGGIRNLAHRADGGGEGASEVAYGPEIRDRGEGIAARWTRLIFACRDCPRMGSYRLAVLEEKFGAEALMPDVLKAISSACLRTRKIHPGGRCQAYLPDLENPRPPDLPRAAGVRPRFIAGEKQWSPQAVTSKKPERRPRPGRWPHRRLQSPAERPT